MRYDQAQFLSLVGCLYETALNPECWKTFLVRLVEMTQSYNAAFHHYDRSDGRENQIQSIVNLDPGAVQSFEEYYSSINPWVVEGIRKRLIREGSVITGQMAIGDSEFEKTEFYADFVKPAGFYHSLGATIHQDARRTSLLTLQRAKPRGAFQQDHLDLMHLVMPHMRRALQIHSRFARARIRRTAWLDSIDRIPAGVIILDGKGRPITLNRAARRILRSADGIRLERTGLEIGDGEQSKRFRHAVSAAVRTAAGEGTGAGGMFSVKRPSNRRPYSVLVSPLPRSEYLSNREHPAAIVFICDPESKSESPQTILSRLFGLTRAETRLACLLMSGESLNQAADRLCIARETARNQLKNIFLKTDVHGQGELMHLLVTSPAALQTSGAEPGADRKHQQR
jgi:DNA-binding CsgD family transcriptional regulator